ncbi:FHA domain-containing protein [uncultured Microbacterium sp.]|uniref:FHA domain-containing protein n=1 Tax=uncultured Microbacterium sp. TaxID=191216 RepID=UPI00260E3B72|nr:FHA domain-containing protein [uncultured Microbacterium sp.]
MTQVRYRPASAPAWRVAVEGSALAVLAPEVTDQTAEAVWRRVGDGGIGAVLEALTGAFGTSLSAIPPFALAVVEPAGVRVAVRGPVEIIVDDEAGTQAVSGEGVSTWTERFLPGARRLTVLVDGASPDGPDLPIRSGVVAASAVTVTLDALVAAPREVRPETSASTPHAVPAPGRPATPAAPATPATPAAEVPEEMRDSEEAPGGIRSSASDISSGTDRAATAPAAPAIPAAPAAPVAPAAEDSEEMGDSEESAPAVPSSASDISSGGNVDAAIVTEVPLSPAASADTWMPAATEAPLPETPADEYDLLWGETVARPITAAAVVVPEASEESEPAAEAPPAAPAEQPTPLGDHDGETVAVADMRAMRAAERATFESTDAVPARRPARGRIVLSTGRVVELERPVVIGRRPKSTRTSGAELPTLVAVDSPEQDISRSHVEIRAEGEHVLVTDLDTTNGTLLLRVGQDPVKLHPNEPTMVVAGDVLDIGDDVTVTFEEIL